MTSVPIPACRQCGSERIWQKGRYRCRVCLTRIEAERRLARTADEVVRDKARANDLRRARRVTDSRWRGQQNARTQAWRETHRGTHRQLSREWYERTAEERRAKKLAEYYAAPEKFYARNLLRRARILEAVCGHGPKCVDDAFLLALYARPCVYCGVAAQAADHLFPLARGGAHCRDNLVPACGSCNSSKSARDPFEWLMSLA